MSSVQKRQLRFEGTAWDKHLGHGPPGSSLTRLGAGSRRMRSVSLGGVSGWFRSRHSCAMRFGSTKDCSLAGDCSSLSWSQSSLSKGSLRLASLSLRSLLSCGGVGGVRKPDWNIGKVSPGDTSSVGWIWAKGLCKVSSACDGLVALELLCCFASALGTCAEGALRWTSPTAALEGVSGALRRWHSCSIRFGSTNDGSSSTLSCWLRGVLRSMNGSPRRCCCSTSCSLLSLWCVLKSDWNMGRVWEGNAGNTSCRCSAGKLGRVSSADLAALCTLLFVLAVLAGDEVTTVTVSVSAWKGEMGDAAEGSPRSTQDGDCSSGVLILLIGPLRTRSTSLSGVSGAFRRLHNWESMLVFTMGCPGPGERPMESSL